MKLGNARENITGEDTRFYTKCESDYLLTDPGRLPVDGKTHAGLVCVYGDFGSERRTLWRLSCN